MSTTRHITADVEPGEIASDGLRARLKTHYGRRYLVTVGGTFGGGTVNVQHQVKNEFGAAEYITYDLGEYLAAGGADFMATGEYIFFQVTGATAPSLDIKFSSVQHGA